MKVCKIKPSQGACSACIDTMDMFGGMLNCGNCHNDEYELLEIQHGFFNDYAIVLKKGKPQKVELSRVYDIREVEVIEIKEMEGEADA